MKNTIGQLASHAGVSTQTLIYYERKGLLPPPARSRANHRVYSPEAVSRVRFVRGAQALGFTLAEIKGLLALTQTPDLACKNMRTRVLEKIAALDEKMSLLAAMRRDLAKLVELCPEEGPMPECPIVETLCSNGAEKECS